SGAIQTPAVQVQEQLKATTPDKKQAKDEASLEALLASGDIKVIPTVLSIFLGNLTDAMTRNFQEKGTLPFGICVGDFGGESCKRSGDVAADYAGSGISGGRQAAEELFSEMLAVKIGVQEQFNILGELSSCPDSAGIYNCRADSGLVQAAESTNGGDKVTVAEAIKKGWLHGEWQLIPPSRGENSDLNFCQNAYCHSNLKVLRQTRILPLGFEIAAANSDPDKPWTLKKVVDGFIFTNSKSIGVKWNYSSYYNTIQNSTVSNTGGNGISQFDENARGGDWHIKDNVILNSGGVGIYYRNSYSSDTIISGNTIGNSVSHGISFMAGDADGSVIYNGSIIDNIIYGSGGYGL
ncbi:MAG: right-handed parallel beta-helix repeat-containing protein, partial [Patescibacteria group bacterium]